MIRKMETICVALYDIGIPEDPSKPIFLDLSYKPPSYFILAVGLGFFSLVKSMIKVILKSSFLES